MQATDVLHGSVDERIDALIDRKVKEFPRQMAAALGVGFEVDHHMMGIPEMGKPGRACRHAYAPYTNATPPRDMDPNHGEFFQTQPPFGSVAVVVILDHPDGGVIVRFRFVPRAKLLARKSDAHPN